MKKLLCSAAVCGLALAANPAQAADGLTLDIGGYFKGYGVYVDEDDAGAVDVNEFDIIRDTEVHFSGETTLDNGLTVGVHVEAEADGGDLFEVDESYAYFSGGWGRVNFGDEDGAAYLLQVEAPSADSNIDGLRQYVQPVNGFGPLDYAQDLSGKASKITYLSPVLNGFQAGVSFSPDTDAADDLEGVGFDGPVEFLGIDPITGLPVIIAPLSSVEETYEAAARYEGQFNNVGVIVGAGYTHQEVENLPGSDIDDRKAWNVGVDLDIGPFGLGAAYTRDNVFDLGDDQDTIVVGADYTTGPFKLGVSYLNVENAGGADDLDADRYSGGVVYTYGPGLTFRGSIGHVELDTAGPGDDDATYVTLGTQINF